MTHAQIKGSYGVAPMTLIRWISKVEDASICDAMISAINDCGLEYEFSRCTREQFFAVIPRNLRFNRKANVNLLAAWTDARHNEVEIELSSNETSLSHSESCLDVSKALSRNIPQLN
jgi:hypothetical protein